MDLTSYAELAVRLVNTAGLGHEGGDLLTSMDGLHALVSDREHLNHGMTRADLETLLMLRDEFRGFFVSCSQGNGAEAAARLNELLIQYPVHPQLSGHDGQAWHVHYTESGSMSDKYAAGAAMGLAVRLADLGTRPVRSLPGGALPGGLRRHLGQPHQAVLLGPLRQPGERHRLPGPQARRRRLAGLPGLGCGPEWHLAGNSPPAARECFHKPRSLCVPRMRLPQTI